MKLLLQFLAAGLVAVALVTLTATKQYSTHLMVPFIKRFRPDLAIGSLLQMPHLWIVAFLPFIFFVVLVIVGSSNAVNLTDGLDGLAIGCTIVAAAALTVLTYVSGHSRFAEYLELQKMPQVAELTVFCGAMVGSSIGFLWYNAHPAEIFMGDVGSLALGGAIGTVAVIIKQELLLPFIGGGLPRHRPDEPSSGPGLRAGGRTRWPVGARWWWLLPLRHISLVAACAASSRRSP